MRSALRMFGFALILCGMGLAGYMFLNFDTSVEVPTTEIMGRTIGGGRVNNLGLMAEKQSNIMMGLGTAILGAALMLAGKEPPKR